MGDRHAGDVYKRHLEDGLSSEDLGPTKKGEKSGVALVSVLGGCTPACDGCQHLCNVGVGVFLFGETGVGEGGAEVTTWDVFHGETDMFCIFKLGM
jgi:hypothetical protein